MRAAVRESCGPVSRISSITANEPVRAGDIQITGKLITVPKNRSGSDDNIAIARTKAKC